MSRIDAIQREVCDLHGITRDDMLGPRRNAKFTLPRFLAMAVVQDLIPDFSYPMIGREFGGRDHTTAINAIRRVNTWRQDPAFDAAYHDMREAISARITPMFRRHRDFAFTTCRKGAST